MTKVVVTVDQLLRPQPGGIGTYTRGLLQGLSQLDGDWDVSALSPRRLSSPIDQSLEVPTVFAPSGLWASTRLWSRWSLGVPHDADIVHATTMAGPFGGGRYDARHSVLVHDVAWRNANGGLSFRGQQFHEKRLQLVRERESVRVFVYSTSMRDTLVDDGFAKERLFVVRLGVDQSPVVPAALDEAAALLREAGVTGSFTLFAGTREPRKNLVRLQSAHHQARERCPELGPLVLVGPDGWGEVPTNDAVVLGPRSREVVRALLAQASVVAYVPVSEGWGLPPVEALSEGTRVVASSDVPSVRDNPCVISVDPLDEESIAQGLGHAMGLRDDEAARQKRKDSVSQLTWRNCALDHLAGWQ